jgi:hypothetical protein
VQAKILTTNSAKSTSTTTSSMSTSRSVKAIQYTHLLQCCPDKQKHTSKTRQVKQDSRTRRVKQDR